MSKVFIGIIFAAFLVVASAAAATPQEKSSQEEFRHSERQVGIPDARVIPPRLYARIVQKIRSRGGCKANVCFILDGSGSIGDFDLIKDFVLDVSSLITDDDQSRVAAVQFASEVQLISKITTNFGAFNIAVDNEAQLGGLSFLRGGINVCIRELLPFVRDQPAKIVILTDGQANLGGSAVRQSRNFRKRLGGSVCAVAASLPNKNQLRPLVGPDGSIFRVEAFLDPFELNAIVEELIDNICT